MQLPPDPETTELHHIEAALSPQRLERYMPASGGDRVLAYRLYLWNCELAEAFHLPVQVAEISLRNAIDRALVARFGVLWFNEPRFKSALMPKYRAALEAAVAAERRQHGSRFTRDHVVSALTFGFWEHLLTKRFDRWLWSKGISHVFPHAPPGVARPQLQLRVEAVRRWRNRIAHYGAIFDKGPARKYQECIQLIRWSQPAAAQIVRQKARVTQVLQARPC